MKGLTVGACVLLMACLIALPTTAQQRSVPSGSSDAGRGTGTAAGATAGSSVSYGSYSGSTTSSSSYSSYSGGMGNRGFGYAGTTSGRPSPNLAGTSFYNESMYWHWSDYYSRVINYYGWASCTGYLQGIGYVPLVNAQGCAISPTYFTRFYRNVEPLMTPALLKVTLRQPLLISQEMLQAIDQIETMLADARSGKTVDRDAIKAKSREIRDYAKRIRQDPTLSVYDIRSETDLLGDDKLDALSPEAIAKLRELALDIHQQLQNLSSLSSSSTVSVDSYKEPSFESMTKGIEKVCKAIENSSKRL